MKILKNNKILDIREAQPDDALEILAALKQVGSESDFLVIDSQGVPLDETQERAYLEKNLSTFNNKTFIGLVDGKIVATGGITGSPRERIKHNVALGLSVMKEYWNLGVATHLMEYIVNYCRMEQDIKNITLEVREDNVYAIRTYEKIGFRYVGKLTNKLKVGDTYYNHLIYELNV